MIFKRPVLAACILAGAAAFHADASPIHVVDLSAGLSFDADSSRIKLSPIATGGTSIFFDHDIAGPDSPGETTPGQYLTDQHYFIYLGTRQIISDPTNFAVDDGDILFDESTLSISAYSILDDGTYVDDSNEYLISGSGLTVTSLAPSTVPLPGSAPMFTAALIGLAGWGYGWRRRNAGAAI